MNLTTECIEGKTFRLNLFESCRTCRKCPKGANIFRNCSKNRDTICSCKKGFFFYIGNNECKLCKKCPAGYGVWRHCSRTRNTYCRRCPSDTFSSVSSSTLGCITCKTCKSNEILLQECTAGQDTVCVGK